MERVGPGPGAWWKTPSVELHEAIRRRAMVRSFSAEPVAEAVVDRLLHAVLRSPTAGNTRGTAWVVLEGSEQTSTYFDATTDEEWRARYPDWADGLRRAPVVLLAYTSPSAYVSRYAEADKSGSGLGHDAAVWPVPYWYGDAAFGVMTVLLGAVDAGLGACILGTFRVRPISPNAYECPTAGASSAPSCSAGLTGSITAPPRSTAPSPRRTTASTVGGGSGAV